MDGARAALASRDAEVAELKARDAERVAAIAKLEEALLQARTATPHATTPRRADNVVIDATPATRSLVSTPVTDPALIPPAQQAAAAMAAAASVAAITATAIAAGGGEYTASLKRSSGRWEYHAARRLSATGG